MPRAWLLNLDAERELAEPRGYHTPRSVAAQISAQRALVAALCEGEPVLPAAATGPPPALDARTVVLPWCPTPTALARIARLNLPTPRAPPLAVLRKVNHRQFQHELRLSLQAVIPTAILDATEFVPPNADGELFAQVSGLAERIAAGLSSGRRYRLERCYGFAGKGARRLLHGVEADDRRWLGEALRTGGLLIEPFLDVAMELSLHGWVDHHGLLVGSPCIQECDAFGAPAAVRKLDAELLPEPIAGRATDVLCAVATRVASALSATGYFGPFGIDALVYRHGKELGLYPLSDLNARFTMGWSIGMGPLRPVALERAESSAT